jgi:LAO/AO transport system kinase
MSAPTDPGQFGDSTQLGRLLTRIENNPAAAEQLLAQLPAPETPALRIGFTGSPGVGKSSLINRVIAALAERGQCVAVVAVDPTSAISGGAVLGDRIRLDAAAPGVFIRSLASRGSLGGVTPAASAVARALEAAGYDPVLIETVGVGQTGYDIVSLADTVVALFSPESGDGVQLLKAGIMEIGDLYVVNKCDRPGAGVLANEIRASLDLSSAPAGHHAAVAAGETSSTDGGSAADGWTPPVLQVSARDGTGVSELVEQLDAHAQWLKALPADHPQRLRRTMRELEFVIGTELGWACGPEMRALAAEAAGAIHSGALTRDTALDRLRRHVLDALRDSWNA